MAHEWAQATAHVMPRKNSIGEKFADFALAIRLPTGGHGKTACGPRLRGRQHARTTVIAPALCTIE
ncbi:hypothetical protein PAQ31011_03878 [Pandoraea aquatica]|uniref:Uncharacterized protein n=1 Tax=Pandoraea aquatica TaxID=2508290 RepID=A0A5E4XFT8_9BURK|nr:hypothetical protein PAQ31011_03878 [Pandoraea aquatica]